MQEIVISVINNIPLVDSRIVSQCLGNEHASLIRLIKEHQNAIEANFGRVGFEIVPFETSGGVQKVTIANLTEDQAIFIGTLSRNSTQSVEFKAKLVSAFSNYRNKAKSLALPSVKELAQMVIAAEEEKERLSTTLQLANTTIQLQAPKVEYFENVLQSESLVSVNVIAGELGMTHQALNRKLDKLGVQYKQGKKWHLHAKYRGLEYAKYKTHYHLDTHGAKQSTEHLYWTQKGKMFIHEIINKSLQAA